MGIPPSRSALGVFLYHPDLGGREETRAAIQACGGRYAVYPTGGPPAPADGSAWIRDIGLYVSIGSMYLIAPMTLKTDEVKDLDRAFVYVTDGPYDPSDTTERIWLAASLPLALNGKDEE